MGKLVNIKDYKIAKIVVADLKMVIKAIDLTIQALSYYKKYGPVSQIISNLQTNKTILEINYAKYKRVLEKND